MHCLKCRQLNYIVTLETFYGVNVPNICVAYLYIEKRTEHLERFSLVAIYIQKVEL